MRHSRYLTSARRRAPRTDRDAGRMPPFDKSQLNNKRFKQRKTFATRRQEVAGIRSKFPNKVPVIIERYEREKFLPPLDKTKFLVPHELTMTQFVTVIRKRMALLPSQAFYLLINNSGLPSMSLTMAQVYKDHQDEDGFLYMTYASQEMFGRRAAPRSASVC
ncbi:microtubule-associated proteins 1A/1B light chain 3C [Acanthochromis polyacanthus]|uniref:Microtubule-associated protein 1 light chain 3 gamma n=1 Tax=Acanthochromis polyacanthus TaxID=80966 RepID=A0A3Q1EQS4_9TELE|nr:microtubule-associated proteins 1A/1B light chain 3C [Acanthochromis polyacanthus]XP_051802236.1 microtubule-associated proteins 1A/1B light chain 3C [Acanthochromis polyacanthus]